VPPEGFIDSSAQDKQQDYEKNEVDDNDQSNFNFGQKSNN